VPGGNQLLQPGKTLDFNVFVDKVTSDPIIVQCDIHGWMDAYLRAFDHPYATTTKEDGTYEIKDVPTGVKVRIIAWHEKADFLNSKNGEEIEVKEGTPLTKDFNLEKK
jgi:hypothetical protein